MKRSIVLLVISILVLSVAGCGRETVISGQQVVASTPGGPTATPRPTPAQTAGTTILADGQLVATVPALPLGFEVNGRLLSVDVQPGDRVEAGDVIAALDDNTLQEAVANAELGLAQTENSLAQAQLSLDKLLDWEPDPAAVAAAEANLAAAEAAYANATTQDAASGNSLTSARVNLERAERGLAAAQENYDAAWDEARDWETFWKEPICDPGEREPCMGPTWAERIQWDREATASGLVSAQDNLEVAQAQYNLAVAGLNNDAAVSANASVLSAQQALEQAQTGPIRSDIAAARLQLEQAELAHQQSQLNLEQSQEALSKAQLLAPWPGTVIAVDVAPGAMVAAGTPVVALLDTAHLQFHTSNLSERDLAQVVPGLPAEITLKTFPEQTIQGTVAGVAPQASGMVGDAAVFTVMIDLKATDLDLRPGMTGRVEISSRLP